MNKPRFKVVAPETFFGPESTGLEVIVVRPGRGDWRVEQTTFGRIELVGFGGENEITIRYMALQDGSVSLAALLSMVDNPILTQSLTVPRPQGVDLEELGPAYEAQVLAHWLNKVLVDKM